MWYRFNYQGRTEKVSIGLPVTYEKLVEAVFNQFGIQPEQQQLLVNNVQITPDTDLSKLKMHLYPIVVTKLKNLNIVIGEISFSTSFYFGYGCSILCNYLIDILKSNGFNVPDFDYVLEIDGKRVNMAATVERSGAVENSTVTIVSRTGERLGDYFDIIDNHPSSDNDDDDLPEEVSDNIESEELPMEIPGSEDELPEEVIIHKGVDMVVPDEVEVPVTSHVGVIEVPETSHVEVATANAVKPVNQTSSVEVATNTVKPVKATPDTLVKEITPETSPEIPVTIADSSPEKDTETPANQTSPETPANQISHQTPNASTSVDDDSLVTVHRRKGKESKKQPPNSEEQRPTELPEHIRNFLTVIRSLVGEHEDGKKAVDEIETILFNCQTRLFDNGILLQEYETSMNDIHYENQMLREMYNLVNPSLKSKVNVESQKNSWQRVSYGNETLNELPDDVEELKKLVNEKYATALMNERRYEKERKRCKKYRLVAQTLGVSEENVDVYYSELHGVAEHRDILKEENLNLKEQIRMLNREIDARDDELRRQTETIQCRDDSIRELVKKLEGMQSPSSDEETTESVNVETIRKDYEEQLRSMESDMNGMKQDAEEEQTKLKQMNEELTKEIAELKLQLKQQEETSTRMSIAEKEELQVQTQKLSSENEELKKTINGVYEETEETIKEENELIQNLTSILEMMNNNMMSKKNRLASLKGRTGN